MALLLVRVFSQLQQIDFQELYWVSCLQHLRLSQFQLLKYFLIAYLLQLVVVKSLLFLSFQVLRQQVLFLQVFLKVILAVFLRTR